MSNISSINDAYLYNISRLAEGFGFDRKTVRSRLNQAQVKPAGRRKGNPVYALSDVGPALFGSHVIPDERRKDPDDFEPKERKEWFQSENERLKFQQNIGELIPEPEYRADLAQVFKVVVAFFESLPDKMERNRIFTPTQLEELERVTDIMRAQLHAQMLEVGNE